jgi:hypothetical protein
MGAGFSAEIEGSLAAEFTHAKLPFGLRNGKWSAGTLATPLPGRWPQNRFSHPNHEHEPQSTHRKLYYKASSSGAQPSQAPCAGHPILLDKVTGQKGAYQAFLATIDWGRSYATP